MSELETGALGPGRIESRELEQEMRSSFLDYAMSRHRLARAAGCARRAEAGAPPRPLLDVDERQPAGPPVREVREHRRLRDGQPSPARRPVDLRHARAPRAAVLAALPARRRPGQLRLDRRRPAGRHEVLLSARPRASQRRMEPCGSATSSRTPRPSRTTTSIFRCSTASAVPCTRRSSSTPVSIRRCACVRARATSSRARTTTRCSVSSTLEPVCRCRFGSCSRRSSPATASLISRARRVPVETELDERARQEALLLGAFVSEGLRLGQARRLQQRRLRLLRRLSWTPTTRSSAVRGTSPDRHDRLRKHVAGSSTSITSSRLQSSPLGELARCCRARRSASRRRVWRALAGVQARLPAGALHRRRLVVAAAAQDDPGVVLDLQRAAREGRPAAAARVRRRLASLPLREGRDRRS